MFDSWLLGDGWSSDSDVLDRVLHTRPMPQTPGRAVFPVASPPAPRTLVDVVMDTVSRHPDAVAVDDGATVLSYAEFLERVEAQAQRLWDLDIGCGDRVGIRVPSGSVDLYVAVLGTIFAGAAYVPVDFDDPDERAATVFVWRSELADTFAESLAVPGLIRLAVGSPVFNVWARLMGARIEPGVWCETWWLPEFDLVHLGRGVSVNRGTVLQTHLFHDRIMRLLPVSMEAGSTLGPNSFILPGSTVEAGASVGPGSLVMAQETVPTASTWGGNPIRPLHSNIHDPARAMSDEMSAFAHRTA